MGYRSAIVVLYWSCLFRPLANQAAVSASRSQIESEQTGTADGSLVDPRPESDDLTQDAALPDDNHAAHDGNEEERKRKLMVYMAPTVTLVLQQANYIRV